jgi:endogenous inhibitor of DNA gyrase (YacG/DUF329 family)
VVTSRGDHRPRDLRDAPRLTYALSVVFAPRCPICREPVEWEGNPARPFCSERCRLVDLSGWVAERYRIPGAADADADEDGESGNDGDSGENDGA